MLKLKLNSRQEAHISFHDLHLQVNQNPKREKYLLILNELQAQRAFDASPPVEERTPRHYLVHEPEVNTHQIDADKVKSIRSNLKRRAFPDYHHACW